MKGKGGDAGCIQRRDQTMKPKAKETAKSSANEYFNDCRNIANGVIHLAKCGDEISGDIP